LDETRAAGLQIVLEDHSIWDVLAHPQRDGSPSESRPPLKPRR
jgi:hypothetical protein